MLHCGFIRVSLDLLVLFGYGVFGSYVMPTVSLVSCMEEIVTFQIDNATAGGMIYMRTEDAIGPIIGTVEGQVMYTCDFATCQINWDEKFHIIVQRRIPIQTDDDLIQWFVCSTDLGSIIPMDVDFQSDIIGNVSTFVRKPEAAMRLFSNGIELPAGSPVKLGTEVNMVLELTNNDDGLLDITPKSCWASSVDLITDHCPVDSDLFGGFTRLSVANLTNTFYMFRPTSASVGPQDVMFLCTLKVCMGSCEQKQCNETGDSDNEIAILHDSDSGDRRRKRDTGYQDDDNVPTIVIGATLIAMADGDAIDEQDVVPEKQLCFPMGIILMALGVFMLFFLSTVGATAFTCYKYQGEKIPSDLIKDVTNILSIGHPTLSTATKSSVTQDERVIKTKVAECVTSPKEKISRTSNRGNRATPIQLPSNVPVSLVTGSIDCRGHSRNSSDGQQYNVTLVPYATSCVRRKSASTIMWFD